MTEQQGDSWVGWIDRLRGWAPLAATLFGVLYAAGFVVVNAYLASWGVHELEAVRTRYVGAGLIFVAFIGIVAFGSGLAWNKLREAPRLRPLFVVVLVAGPAVLAGLEAAVVWRANAGPFGDHAIPESFGPRFVLAAFVMNVFVMIFATGVRVLAAASLRSYAAPARGLFAWVAAFAFAGVVVGYATYIYPAIPAFLGGGAPTRVRLVASPPIAEACPPCVSGDVLLIDADAHRWVVLARDASGREIAVEIFLFPNADKALIHTRP